MFSNLHGMKAFTTHVMKSHLALTTSVTVRFHGRRHSQSAVLLGEKHNAADLQIMSRSTLRYFPFPEENQFELEEYWAANEFWRVCLAIGEGSDGCACQIALCILEPEED